MFVFHRHYIRSIIIRKLSWWSWMCFGQRRRWPPLLVTECAVSVRSLYKAKGWLVGAERNVKRCGFADFGNSPFDYTAEKVSGKDIVFTTTNGTRAITIAKSAFRVITGAFINLQAVAGYCVRHKRDVVVLCSGWQDKVNIEDTLFGGALTDALLNTGLYEAGSDAAVIARDMWTGNKANLLAYLDTTDHMGRLKANHLEDAVPYCLTLSITDKVPELSIEGDTLILR